MGACFWCCAHRCCRRCCSGRCDGRGCRTVVASPIIPTLVQVNCTIQCCHRCITLEIRLAAGRIFQKAICTALECPRYRRSEICNDCVENFLRGIARGSTIGTKEVVVYCLHIILADKNTCWALARLDHLVELVTVISASVWDRSSVNNRDVTFTTNHYTTQCRGYRCSSRCRSDGTSL